ncbi:carboxypeptidase-like regulatory domain-containing protein [Zhouia sp. PK063]|uniref:carboxypeptidase-like regulatory domain-containing protein n=1 Tax=Zhouia sp. PK063 TaxID=3373602 RepID=UPI0037A20CDA
MKPNFFYFTIFFVFSATSVFAQETFILKGEVTHDKDDMQGLNVFNLTTKKGSVTNKDGYFEIEVSVNDSINITSIQYRTIAFHVVKEMNGETLPMTAQEKINELDEVVVTPFHLSGNLSMDVKNNQSDAEKYTASNLNLPNAYVKSKTIAERKLYEASSGSGILPLNPILNAISGRKKRLKNALALEKQEQYIEKLKGMFGDDFYEKTLQIPEIKKDAFLYYCVVDKRLEHLITANNKFYILQFLIAKAKLFNTKPKEE